MKFGKDMRAKRNASIAQRVAKGETLRSVAADLNLSVEHIRQIAIAAGVPRRTKEKNTAEIIRSARRLWSRGMSASQIGEAMGVTKNVVIGIAHRNDFPARRRRL